MPQCPNCKTEVNVGHKFCFECGTKLPQEKSCSFTDPRDGNVYKTVKIGNQVWLADNFRYNCEGSYAYGNDKSNVKKYGYLYTWEAAVNCVPAGWHLPTDEEFAELMRWIDDHTDGGVGTALKSTTDDWSVDEDIPKGSDEFGFAALPAGRSGGDFRLLGKYAFFWTASVLDEDKAYYRTLGYDCENFDEYWGSKTCAHSVRLLRD